ncbi:MAG: hypothetical protein NTX33_08790 [Propionibacteriales bacterium]|nr:hypothetical protein [Propionibacteriales bacterium]
MSAELRRTTAVLVVVALALSVVLMVQLRDSAPPGQASRFDATKAEYSIGTLPDDDASVVRAAVEAIQVGLAYDYRRLDEGLRAATALMTPKFADSFTAVFDKAVRADATKQQAVAVALVKGAGVVSRSDRSAVCLAFVDQIVTTGDGTTGQPRNLLRARVRVELQRVDGQWRVSSIDPVN